MKNLIIFLILCAFSFNPAVFAQEISDFSQTTMPTDEEIRQVIEKYNFNDSQKELLFKETKKQLQEIYSDKNSPKQNKSEKKYSNHPPLHTKQNYGPNR